MRRFSWKTVRVSILLMALLLVGSWGFSQFRKKHKTWDWRTPLSVRVIVLNPNAQLHLNVELLRKAIPKLEAVLQRELRRYLVSEILPFRFEVSSAITVSKPPPEVHMDGDVWQRATDGWKLKRYFDAIEDADVTRARVVDVSIYLIAEPSGGEHGQRFVEGFSEQGADYGVVRVSLHPTMVDQALIAAAHETFHCLGATDKYDELGHATDPEGLVEPHKEPRYPQTYGEIMVGELPLEFQRGRLLRTLDELGVGPLTAKEIGWILPANN